MCIKTFCRPSTLYATLDNIIVKSRYHDLSILVADDSDDDYKKKNGEIVRHFRGINKNLRLLEMPFDVGLSRGRNLLVENCKTKYALMLDDSRHFTRDTKIEKMVDFLRETDYHLVGGVIPGRGRIDSHYTGMFEKIRHDSKSNTVNIWVDTILERIDYDKIPVFKTNVTLNCFIAKTELLRRCRWRDELKTMEHENFFLDWYNMGYRCAVSFLCPFVENSAESRQYPAKYRHLRYDPARNNKTDLGSRGTIPLVNINYNRDALHC